MVGQALPPARDLVGRMTLDEKLSLVHGVRDPRELGQAGYWPGLPRLGIPPLRFADGPPGVNANRDATAMPAPVALAATFSSEAARMYGVAMGREARALEQNVLLAPHVNIVRDPLFRRNHTTFSEDPLLAAAMAEAEIAGIQSQGVMAQVKHLAAYNGSENVVVDERTLHEIYLPPFEAAVRAGVASVMCGYNRVNGAWACGNSELQNDILRGLWRFAGFVTSDWGATHGPADITRGLDLEMPGRELAGRRGGPYFTAALKEAVESGAIPVSAVDNAVTRILKQMARFGLLGRKATAKPGTIDVEADARIVRRIAAQGAVLLKNEGEALPLSGEDLGSLVLIGPTAAQLAAGFMGERGYGFEARLVAPLAALRKSAPRARIGWSAGVDLTGTPLPGLSHEDDSLAPGDHSWSGVLEVPEDGEYTFLVQPLESGGSEGGGSITVDGLLAARTGGPGFGGTGMISKKWSGLVPTTDGRDNGRGAPLGLSRGPHKVALMANSIGEGPLRIRFAWITPAFRRAGIEAAAAAAKSARTAVVFAWAGTGGNSLSLPDEQDRLIERVAAANPRTVVVLNTGGPVAMPWRDKVRAILEMWYPGQEGGWATADLLMGRAAPGGKLPVTFPARLEDAPTRAAGHPERLAPAAPPGASGTNPDAPVTTFSEGIAVGYRWYDQQKIDPLFPFGHGLSYTRFEYSGLAVKRAGDDVDVSFTVRNPGPRPGAEVAQVYLGPAEGAPVAMAPKSLAGFRRVELGPGRRAAVTVRIDARQLAYWSVERHDWVRAAGGRAVYVGASSRDVRLVGRLTLSGKAR
jgi:beta-glucosidase